MTTGVIALVSNVMARATEGEKLAAAKYARDFGAFLGVPASDMKALEDRYLAGLERFAGALKATGQR